MLLELLPEIHVQILQLLEVGEVVLLLSVCKCLNKRIEDNIFQLRKFIKFDALVCLTGETALC